MIFVCAGMYRSGSTWMYNAARLILQEAGVEDLAAGWVADREKILTHKNVLIKVHEFCADLASQQNIILTSHRDLRDVAASLSRRARQTISMPTLREAVEAHAKWAAFAAYDMRYENMLRDRMSELKQVSRRLGIPPAILDKINYEAILEKLEKEKFAEGRTTKERFDAVNLLHDGHVTDGRHGSWNETLPAEMVKEIEREFVAWFNARGYVTPGSPHVEKLADYAATVYAQFGEDGIIAKIFEIIGTRSKVCVEFGAWDGFWLANTANLWAKQGWKGVLIEAVPERYLHLKENVKQYDVRCVQGRVEVSGENSLENILKREGFKNEVDLLSIDIDSEDYYILQSLTWLTPRVVICEYNPTIPPHMELIPAQGNHIGCAALSLIKLAEEKGYKLVAVTETNCIFVRAEDFPKFSKFETAFEKIAVTTQVTYVISNYDGDYALTRTPTYGWRKPLTQEFAVGGLVAPIAEKPTRKKSKPWHVLKPAEKKIRAWRKRVFSREKS